MVAAEDRHAVAGLKPRIPPGIGQSVGPQVDLAEAEPAELVDETHLVALLDRRPGGGGPEGSVSLNGARNLVDIARRLHADHPGPNQVANRLHLHGGAAGNLRRPFGQPGAEAWRIQSRANIQETVETARKHEATV